MTELTPVAFYEDTVYTVEHDGQRLFVVKTICETLGLAWNGQLARIKRNPVLAKGMHVMRIPSAGGMQETTCLPLRLLNGWLMTMDVERVKPELRDKLIRYQEECFDALDRYFNEGVAINARFEEDEDVLPARTRNVVAAGRLDDGRLALNIVREARVLFGKQAAVKLWPALGLPQIEAQEIEDGDGDEGDIRAFARQRLVRRIGARTEIGAVYAAYVAWAEATNRRSVSRQFFTREMTVLGIADKGQTTMDHRRVRFFHDIEIKSAVMEAGHE